MSFTPYPFQEEDIELISKVKAGLIASEMGTGKTHEAIALDMEWWRRTKAKGERPGPTLVVAPLNTHDGWQEKYAMQEPSVDVVRIDRKDRDAFVRQVMKRQGDVFVCHWESLVKMPELRQMTFNTVVADEIHRASNRKTQQTLALKKLPRVHALGLSGTAAGDKPDGLWSVNNFLWPTYYKSYWKFRKHYMVEETSVQGYTKIVGLQNVESLHREMEKWYVRHLKKEQCCEHHPDGVMWWLPDKTYEHIFVELSPKQRKIYDQMHKNFVAWVGENENSPLVASVVVAQMARLSQIALATPEFDNEGNVILTEPSSKMDAVQELIGDHTGKAFVVFSASKKGCYLLEQKLNRAGITAAAFTGDTKDPEREAIKRDFRAGNLQVFIGSIAAVGEGVDGLQEVCDTGIFLDRHWSSWRNKQAEDRLHRDGQQGEAVQIFDIMARNTLDFGRHTRLENKWSWIKQMLGDTATAQQKMIEEG